MSLQQILSAFQQHPSLSAVSLRGLTLFLCMARMARPLIEFQQKDRRIPPAYLHPGLLELLAWSISETDLNIVQLCGVAFKDIIWNHPDVLPTEANSSLPDFRLHESPGIPRHNDTNGTNDTQGRLAYASTRCTTDSYDLTLLPRLYQYQQFKMVPRTHGLGCLSGFQEWAGHTYGGGDHSELPAGSRRVAWAGSAWFASGTSCTETKLIAKLTLDRDRHTVFHCCGAGLMLASAALGIMVDSMEKIRGGENECVGLNERDEKLEFEEDGICRGKAMLTSEVADTVSHARGSVPLEISEYWKGGARWTV
ncbi:hypothetical protein B0H17DRAFT_1140615 [Mycena rosella]|uniref:Uncharacterized protein n=1 Tax=Mycena rosella TaxID=1033263 RepID=A0AAD7D248_MYCRO|nr:hypothetical protein B0H17DRAFT_1140615 [Mycena rosella]